MKSSLTARKRTLTNQIPGFEGDEVLTAEKITKMINDAVHGTVNSAISNLKKTDLPKIVKESLTEGLSAVNVQMESINEALKALKPEPGSGGGGGGEKQLPPEVSAEIKNLKDNAVKIQKQMDDMKLDKDKAEQRAKTLERHTKIRTALGTVKEGYANDAAMNTAFTIVEPLIKEIEDGTLVGGDNLPVEDFVKDYLPKQHPYLLRPTGSGGAGASGGSGGSGGGRAATMEDIKPGMTAAERSKVLSAIQAAGNNR